MAQNCPSSSVADDKKMMLPGGILQFLVTAATSSTISRSDPYSTLIVAGHWAGTVVASPPWWKGLVPSKDDYSALSRLTSGESTIQDLMLVSPALCTLHALWVEAVRLVGLLAEVD